MDTNATPGTIIAMKRKSTERTPTYVFDPAKLAARRARIGKSQTELAAILKMPQSNYARIESGARANPSLDTAVRIAKALGCIVEDLIAE